MRQWLGLIAVFFCQFSFADVATTQLSFKDQQVLDRGEIKTFPYVAGGIIGTYPGFGLGHVIQGRYRDAGWIFTVGELGSLAFIVGSCSAGATLDDCLGNAIVGAGAFVGFKIWEIVDVWYSPYSHNKKYRRLKETAKIEMRAAPIIMADNKAGLGFEFRF